MNASKTKMAELDHAVYDEIARYDRIVLATPIWAGKTMLAINAILEKVDFNGKEVYVMTTQAMPAAKDTEERKIFYQEKIEKKKGKPPRSEDDLIRQVDERVNIESMLNCKMKLKQ